MEHLKTIKRALTSQVEAQMGNLEKVNTHELGEAIDMIKDLADAMYHCSIVEAMEKAEEEEKNGNGTNNYYYTERFLPPYYYDDYRIRDRRDIGKTYYGGDYNYNRYNVYDNERRDMPTRDMREGRSGATRRMYMEAKEMHQEKEVQLKELEHYMQELSQDVTEMIHDASPEEKELLHKKLTSLANKIEVLSKQ